MVIRAAGNRAAAKNHLEGGAMGWRHLWLIVVLTIFPCTLWAEDAGERYVCIADKVTGFQYDEAGKEWQATSFVCDDEKYILSACSEKYAKIFNAVYCLTEMGRDFPSSVCEEGFNEGGSIFCAGKLPSTFSFSKNTGRYLITNHEGYFGEDKEFDLGGKTVNLYKSTPFVEIGKCSPYKE